ncbi:MAG: hypothetical protein BAA01_08595 [Bacillus thermozeamaize]|uniref:EamA domain-containing protein n=1 Tax=Bacillus thermozeamaize TaxID=230954 RepID=A0A1Y3PQ24_9BACI|nr:MAG: hypothetical protein BAA01_08595 [Bacillus thermozeamaize]
MKHEARVFLLLALTACLWGLSITLVRHLNLSFPATALAGIRSFIAGLFLFGVAWSSRSLTPVPPQGWRHIFMAALFLVYLQQMALSWGLRFTHAATAGIIIGLEPVLTILFAAWWLRERMSLINWLGVFLGFAGVCIIVLSDTEDSGFHGLRLGELITLGAVLSAAIGSMFVKKAVACANAMTVTAYSFLIASGCFLLTMGVEWLIFPTQDYPTQWLPWALLLFTGIVSIGLCNLWWNYGIQQVGASRASHFLNLIPVSSLLFSVWLLGEPASWWHLLALVFILLGVTLGLRPVSIRTKSRPLHDSIQL